MKTHKVIKEEIFEVKDGQKEIVTEYINLRCGLRKVKIWLLFGYLASEIPSSAWVINDVMGQVWDHW